MIRKLIAWACILVSMACLLGMLRIVIESWPENSAWRKAVTLLALFGWVHITYSMLTFKYLWLQRLVGKEHGK